MIENNSLQRTVNPLVLVTLQYWVKNSIRGQQVLQAHEDDVEREAIFTQRSEIAYGATTSKLQD